MVAAGVVAVALLLGSRAEAPRELKFRGALLAQADTEVSEPPMPEVAPPTPRPLFVNVEAMQRDLDELVRTRPTLKAATIVLAVGGGVTLLGITLMVGGAIGAGWSGLGVAVIGLLVGASGLVLGIVGVVMMIASGVAQHDADVRIRELKARIGQAAPPTLPPASSGMDGNLSTVLLARF
jgi:hypothetical protein